MQSKGHLLFLTNSCLFFWWGFRHDANFTPNFFFACRRAALELILPKAQLFQEGVDSLQQWFMSVEQTLAQLRNAERVMLHLPEATDRAKVREFPRVTRRNLQTWKCAFFVIISHLHVWNVFTQAVVEEIQIKSADLGEIQKSGQDLMEALSGNAVSISQVLLLRISYVKHRCVDMPCFRGRSPAGAGEDGHSPYPLLRAEFEQPGCAPEAGAGPGGLQSLHLKPGGPSLVAGPHWEGTLGGCRSTNACWRCSTMLSWETKGNVLWIILRL